MCNNTNWQKDMRCVDVPPQTYECCYHIYLPWLYTSPCNKDIKQIKNCVSIDKCLLPEILTLWEMGIKTTGCCCGHGCTQPYIGVEFSDIEIMKELGYQVQYNKCRPNDEDSFFPKTQLNYDRAKCTEV